MPGAHSRAPAYQVFRPVSSVPRWQRESYASAGLIVKSGGSVPRHTIFNELSPQVRRSAPARRGSKVPPTGVATHRVGGVRRVRAAVPDPGVTGPWEETAAFSFTDPRTLGRRLRRRGPDVSDAAAAARQRQAGHAPRAGAGQAAWRTADRAALPPGGGEEPGGPAPPAGETGRGQAPRERRTRPPGRGRSATRRRPTRSAPSWAGPFGTYRRGRCGTGAVPAGRGCPRRWPW